MSSELATIVLWTFSSIAGAVEFQTAVEPLEEDNILHPCSYQLWLGNPKAGIRAVWVVFERGEDTIRFYRDLKTRRFAATRKLGLMLASHCRSKDREDMDVEPAHGIGRAVFRALEQFAKDAGQSGLANCRVLLIGWSGAGALVARWPAFAPDRVLGVIAYAPGQYDPLGMNTIELSREAAAVPQLIIANGADSVNGTARPYGYFAKYWSRDAPWTFIIQNRTPHCCLQNVETLILAWVDAVLEPPRRQARFGFLRLEESEVRDTWQLPVSNILSARVSEKRELSSSREIPAGLLSGVRFAREWLRQTRFKNPKNTWTP